MNRVLTIASDTIPKVKNCLWLKPVSGGFALYFVGNGACTPLNLVDTNGTSDVQDDIAKSVSGLKNDLIGSVQDEASSNTINGAKAYATAVGSELVGDATDETTSMTLYGLKNYIDAQIQGLG